MPETDSAQKPFVNIFSDSCVEYARLSQEIHNIYRGGVLDKHLKDIEIKRDEIFGAMIQSTAEKLLSTDPEKRLDFIAKIESEGKRLKGQNEMLTYLFDPNEFTKTTLLRALEFKEKQNSK